MSHSNLVQQAEEAKRLVAIGHKLEDILNSYPQEYFANQHNEGVWVAVFEKNREAATQIIMHHYRMFCLEYRQKIEKNNNDLFKELSCNLLQLFVNRAIEAKGKYGPTPDAVAKLIREIFHDDVINDALEAKCRWFIENRIEILSRYNAVYRKQSQPWVDEAIKTYKTFGKYFPFKLLDKIPSAK